MKKPDRMEGSEGGVIEGKDLMKPRYKAIASFWHSPFKENQIIELVFKHDEWICEVTGCCYKEFAFRNYPHLFKPLEWFEERNPKDLPEYVKGVNENFTGVFKVTEWRTASTIPIVLCEDGKRVFGMYQIEPATLTEYTNYQKIKG